MQIEEKKGKTLKKKGKRREKEKSYVKERKPKSGHKKRERNK
jgi:hypothetical protein